MLLLSGALLQWQSINLELLVSACHLKELDCELVSGDIRWQPLGDVFLKSYFSCALTHYSVNISSEASVASDCFAVEEGEDGCS